MTTFYRRSLVFAIVVSACGAVRADFISNTLGSAGPGPNAAITHPQLVNGNIFTNQNLLQPNTDARNAATTFANLASTAGMPTSINGTTTIHGGPGLNVANLSESGPLEA